MDRAKFVWAVRNITINTTHWEVHEEIEKGQADVHELHGPTSIPHLLRFGRSD